jgi:TetR/AcrR family transcriptional regulator, repressor for divergent bdcA
MVTTKQSRPRGRPRRFDPEEALATAQQLFHAKGYDALSVVDITTALGINPPSFYAAYGSKAGLYARILDHYAETGAIPLQRILRPDRPLAESLAELLVEAAKAYAGNPATSGCLVLEGTRSNDPDARAAACVFHVAAQEAIRDFIAKRNPRDADRLADMPAMVVETKSASARHGQSLDRLLATARIAATALAHGIPPE